VNYWLGCGLLVLVVGILFYALGRETSRRIKRDGLRAIETGNSGAVVLLGYMLPAMGLLFILIGLGETLA
jgi:hypothetical protein